MSSGSDIISALLKKNTPKRTVEKKSYRSAESPSAVMIRSMSTLAQKAVEERIAIEREEPEEHTFDNDVYEHNEDARASPIASIAAEAAPVAAPAVVTREMVANTLKAKVSEAINYQLLDILNNGSADEVKQE